MYVHDFAIPTHPILFLKAICAMIWSGYLSSMLSIHLPDETKRNASSPLLQYLTHTIKHMANHMQIAHSLVAGELPSPP
jgi:hypothetical protein